MGAKEVDRVGRETSYEINQIWTWELSDRSSWLISTYHSVHSRRTVPHNQQSRAPAGGGRTGS